MSILEQIEEIKPGTNYPSYVSIEETVNDKKLEIKFLLQSYFVGMYMAIYADGNLVTQTGDHNNRGCVTRLKKDIQRALDRGASVDIGKILPVKDKF